MFLKSVFQNKIFINILFFALLFLSALSIIRANFLYADRFHVPMFDKLNANIRINVEMPEKNVEKITFFADDNIIEPTLLYDGNSYILFGDDNSPASKLFFQTDEKTLDSIDNIVINLGKNFYYWNNDEIKKFKKIEGGYYILPDIKYYKNSNYIGDKGAMHSFFTRFLSIFYNSNFYVFSIICLFLAGLLYAFNKDKINLGFNIFKNHAIWWIVLLGVVFRLQNNGIPFWGDELYTAVKASAANAPLSALFQDPGNPPLFFILEKIWILIFGNGEIQTRILPTIFSVAAIPFIYLLVKRNLDEKISEKAALLASFLYTINVYSIHSAQEIRSYSLCGFLTVVLAYYLFEIIKYKKTKDFILYAIFAGLIANTHFFGILYLFVNFVFAVFVLDEKSTFKFLLSNIGAAIIFLPYFIVTGLKRGLLDSNFNKMPFYGIRNTGILISCYFSNVQAPIYLGLVTFILAIKKVREKITEEDNKFFRLYFFSFMAVLGIFVSSYLFSLLVRPIVKGYYFIVIVPFISTLVALTLFIPFKNKIIKIINVLFILSFSVFCFTGRGVYVSKDDVMVIRLEEQMKYAYYDSNSKYKNTKKIGFPYFDYIEYLDYYKEYFKDNFIPIQYGFGIDSTKSFDNKLQYVDAKVFYTMVHKERLWQFVQDFKDSYKISSIITDKGVILLRMIKK